MFVRLYLAINIGAKTRSEHPHCYMFQTGPLRKSA